MTDFALPDGTIVSSGHSFEFPPGVLRPGNWLDLLDEEERAAHAITIQVPAAPEPGPPPVPLAITPLQARRALDQLGLRDAVEAHVANLPRAERDAWEYAIEVRRDDPTIASGAAALGLTTEQVDQLFIAGAAL